MGLNFFGPSKTEPSVPLQVWSQGEPVPLSVPIPAGGYLVQRGTVAEGRRFWSADWFQPAHAADPRESVEEFRGLLRSAVQQRLGAPMSTWAQLSGGLDSSLVVAMMAEASARPVNTFTIGFGGNTGTFIDERPLAREVAERYGLSHRELEVQPQVEEALDVALRAFDEPFADDSVIPTHFICAAAREQVTVALTGLGGDENFAGYERYLGFQLSQTAERSPWRQALGLLRPGIRALREERGGHYRINHLKRFVEAHDLPPAARWQKYGEVFSMAERRALYSPSVARQIDFEGVDRMGRQYYERADADDPLDRAIYQDIKMYLPDDILALTDRIGMWHSLELRVPFVDHTLMEFCARIPGRLKLRWGRKKALLRRAAAPFLPKSVLHHRKQGFAAPMAVWLRGDLRAFTDRTLSSSETSRFGILNGGEVARHVDAHRTRRRLNDKQIFAMLMFQRWLELTGAGRTAKVDAAGASACAL